MLADLLKKAVENVPDKPALAFSGGLDSSLLAFLLREKHPMLYTVGTAGCHDFSAGESAAELLGLEWRKFEISRDEIKQSIPIIKEAVKGLPDSIIVVSFTMPLYFVCKNCSENVVVSGQGPDSMFGGFERYLRMAPEDAQREMRNGTLQVSTEGKAQQEAVAAWFGKRAILPYLDKRIVDYALTLPFEQKVRGDERKIVLKEAARELGLPEELVGRRKKSAQYSSGFMKVIRKR